FFWLIVTKKQQEIVANIRYAKQFFKDLGVYKKGFGKNGQGGLGGIGIETWILQNGGSFDEAIKTFKEAINISDSFDTFKDNYLILGAGDNIKQGGMENFTYNMTEEGYTKIVKALKKD
ncbi:MAG: hypothetical protein Q9M94_00515, partial [Candidatus Gracilibacteria bacterium]|nr:hypothetical protein [Candidatus Gracilibacteria bacterium]